MKSQPTGWRWKIALLATLVLCTVRALATSVISGPSEKVLFDIDAGAATQRLNEFGTQSHIQLVFNFEDMQGVVLAGVHGEFKPADALNVMLSGTNVTYQFLNRKTLAFQRPTDARPAKALSAKTGRHGTGDRRTSDTRLEEVTISTDHQPSISATGSPVVAVTRADIDATGFVTVQGVIRTLPQIFGGGPTEDTSQGFEARTNTARGTGVNLRGLGASSTLVLMNGRRLASGGSEGLFVDISNLPLAAIERIDILPDSSSTFYGTDAVAGVANFVMRDRFDGRQTEAYIGDSTRGRLGENYVSQIIGAQTDKGHGLLALDFYSRDDLPASSRRLARSDLREFGGSNFDTAQSNPGNIVVGSTLSWAIPRGQDGTALTAASFQGGTQNLENQWEAADILPSQQRWSAFGTWHEDTSDSLSLFGDTLFSQRNIRGNGSGQTSVFQVPVTNPFYVNPTGVPGPVTVRYNFLDDLGPLLTEARVQSLDSSGGVELRLRGGWRATASAGYASEKIRSSIENQVNPVELNKALQLDDRLVAFNPFGDGSYTNRETLESLRAQTRVTYDSSLTSGELLVSGPLRSLAGGDVTLSFGGGAREQSLRSTIMSTSTATPTDIQSHFNRTIHSGFAELVVPVFGPANRLPGFEALSFSLAERFERYSDFGTNLASRLGLSWAPYSGVTVRGSYAESFRPPGLVDLDESNNAYGFTQLRDPQTGGASTVLLLVGKNHDLHEENARSWTAGLELEPDSLPGSALAITYFSTNFSNRLSKPTLTADVLSNPTLATLVMRQPSTEYRENVCARSPQLATALAGDCVTTPVAAIVDLRTRNDAVVQTRGFDMLARYSRASALGRFSFSLNGTYILDFAESRAANLPLDDHVNTTGYPINLKMRGSARWEHGGWDVAAYVNYLNNYRDTASIPQRNIDSWTTVDFHAAYTFGHSQYSWFGDTTFSLGIDNALDSDPPFVNNVIGIGYDQENGDLTGRMVSFNLRKKW